MRRLLRIIKANAEVPFFLKILIGLILCIHAVYLAAFCAMGEKILIYAGAFSLATYLFALKLIFDSKDSSKLVIAVIQIAILIHALICEVILGWGYGFELIFLISTIMLFFSPFSYKRLNYSLITLQIFTVAMCYVSLGGEAIRPPDAWQDALFIFNLISVCFLSLIISYFLEILNAFAFLNVLEQKEHVKQNFLLDPLTKLLNRASMQNILDGDRKIFGAKFAVVMGDIDDFKKINDAYGHGAGDATLISIAEILKGALKETDLVARWGGEEFLAVLRDADARDAVAAVERIKDKLNQNAVEFQKASIKATMTFGVVTLQEGENFNLKAMIKQADELLYKGKRSGKNKVVSAKFDPSGI